MVRKKAKQELPPKVWTLQDIDKGIEKLRRRIADVRSLLADQVRFNDARKDAVSSEITATIEDVFGTDSREHRENSYVSFSKGPFRRAAFNESRAIIDHRSQQSFNASIPDVIAMIEGLIRRLEEKKAEISPSYGSQSNAQTESASAQSIEQRLVRLSELKSKGLISEQEYSSRREKILDEI
jgi:hypothetical protein